MNEATKARWANILTALVTIATLAQGTFLTEPPFTQQMVFVISSILTYAIMTMTAFKQYLSPDVNSTGTKVTLWVIGIATIGGLSDLIGIFNLQPTVAQYIKLAISFLVMVLNVVSKQLFPSIDQKVKMNELKHQ